MSRASARVGWGRNSWKGLAGATFSGLLAAAFWAIHYWDVVLLLGVCAAMSTFFAFVHPHRILEIDDDDGPQDKVGKLLDE